MQLKELEFSTPAQGCRLNYFGLKHSAKSWVPSLVPETSSYFYLSELPFASIAESYKNMRGVYVFPAFSLYELGRMVTCVDWEGVRVTPEWENLMHKLQADVYEPRALADCIIWMLSHGVLNSIDIKRRLKL